MRSFSVPEQEPFPAADRNSEPWRWILISLLPGILLASLLWHLSPPGLLGKADAIALAFCHRMETHSFRLDDRPLPFCARCTGTFLGALAGVLTLLLFGRGRAARWPTRGPGIVLGSLALLWAADGANSFLPLFPRIPQLYSPSNAFRLVSGLGFGMALAAFYLPALAQSFWREPRDMPSLGSWADLIAYLAALPVLGLLVLCGNPLLLYPLALASALSALVLLAGIYAVGVAIVTKRENRAGTWAEVVPLLLAGGTLAMLQIAAVDAFRLFLFGSWSGFPGLS
ncbi:MAG: DUF2085 domain-containing protein [Anaerolineales bacterium]